MATEVKLPELGEGVTEGELVKWLVKVGDTVKPDQPVAEVMTDKATVEVPTPVGGVVKDLRFKVGPGEGSSWRFGDQHESGRAKSCRSATCLRIVRCRDGARSADL